MNKTTLILNLIIYLFSVAKAINETNTSTNSDEISDRLVEAVTVRNSYDKGSTNVVNKLDFLKEPETENDDDTKINPRRHWTTTDKSIPVAIDYPEESSEENFSNESESIDEDANELIENVNISDKENKTEDYLESDFEQESVTYESVIYEDTTEKPSDELSSDREALDDKHTRRMMTDRYWAEGENVRDENDFKKIPVLKNYHDVLLDVKARSEKDNAEQVAITKPETTTEINVKAPAIFNNYGNNMNNPASIQHAQYHPSVNQPKCLQTPALLNLRHSKPAALNDVSSYERSNYENSYPLSRDNFPPQIPLQSVEEPVVSRQPQRDVFNYNLFSNAYPYTPTLLKTTLDDPIGNSIPNLFSKLIDASQNSNIGQKLLNINPFNRMYFNNFEPRNPLLPKYNVYNYVNRYRRYARCCRH
ncbi:uncharacterized protein LOC124540835 isoform X2 [Vanessa cardui]|uniref:uncharacterized protein LOC124540835 isoform X2 n=1 Tax=Vanessa cardui TaxID=171605 RepID=UPI001F13DC3D|nr:uncharacterized protein LOC124540835 isoform X2 [Vanessa cardui]